MPFAKIKNTPIVSGVDKLDRAALFEIIRLTDIANAWKATFIGGSRNDGLAGAGPADAWNYLDIELDGVLLAGYVIQFRVEVKTSNVGTSIEPQIWDVTTSSVLTTTGGAASTSTSWVSQTLVVTALPAAVRKYRLQFLKNNATNDVFGIGYLELKSP